MTILSDLSLAQLYPEYRGDFGPASIDLHIGTRLLAWPTYIVRDPRYDQSKLWKPVALEGTLDDGYFWTLKPGVRYLAATQERIRIPDDAAGFLSARSSWGRDGLAVICGPAGFLDPGFHGNVVLELSVVGSDLIVWPGAAVCQLVLSRLTTPCLRPYSGKYQGQDDVTPSRLFQEIRR